MSRVVFVITKQTRDTDRPYAGRSCTRAGVPSGSVYTDIGEAKSDARKLQTANPCGWKVKPVIL